MKKVILFVVLMFVLAACVPVSNFVEIPAETQTGVTLVIATVLGLLFSKIPVVGDFLQGYKGVIALALSSPLIAWISINTPDAYGNIVLLLLQLVIAVAAALASIIMVKYGLGHYSQGIKGR